MFFQGICRNSMKWRSEREYTTSFSSVVPQNFLAPDMLFHSSPISYPPSGETFFAPFPFLSVFNLDSLVRPPLASLAEFVFHLGLHFAATEIYKLILSFRPLESVNPSSLLRLFPLFSFFPLISCTSLFTNTPVSLSPLLPPPLLQ